MIGAYAFSLKGTSHDAKGIPCQDASAVAELARGLFVAVVADGLGSAPRSQEGSVLAVSALRECLVKAVSSEDGSDGFDFENDAPALLRCAFASALDAIEAKAAEEDVPLCDFDTTLTACLFNGSRLAYGQVGDGGAVALCADGLYRQVTVAQKGDAVNETIPLRGRSFWRFGLFMHEVASVALMTDGIYDIVCPLVLADSEQPVYVAFARPFLDNGLTHMSNEADFEDMCQRASAFIEGLPGSQVSDDKTIAVLMNSDVRVPIQPEEYYRVPDFKALHEERVRKLYGVDRFTKEDECSEEQDEGAMDADEVQSAVCGDKPKADVDQSVADKASKKEGMTEKMKADGDDSAGL